MLLCLSDPLQAAHQHRGAPERGHPVSLRLCSTEASVSHSAHNTTLLLLQLAALPPRSPGTACLSARQGPTRLRSGWGEEQRQYWLLISLLLLAQYLCLCSLFIQAAAPQAGGAGPLGDRVWRSYYKHICITYVWTGPWIVHILSPSGFTDKSDFKLQKMQIVVWLIKMAKDYLRFQKFSTWTREQVEVLHRSQESVVRNKIYSVLHKIHIFGPSLF